MGDFTPLAVSLLPSRRRHTRCLSDWSSDVCSSDLQPRAGSTSQAWRSRLCWFEWASVWSPFFQSPPPGLLGSAPVGHRPVAHRLPSRRRRVRETRVQLRSAAVPPRLAPPSETASGPASHGLSQAVIRTVAGLGVVGASAARLTTPNRAIG